jgi:hypothetical protein
VTASDGSSAVLSKVFDLAAIDSFSQSENFSQPLALYSGHQTAILGLKRAIAGVADADGRSHDSLPGTDDTSKNRQARPKI